jgi:hypothetical protein
MVLTLAEDGVTVITGFQNPGIVELVDYSAARREPV